jgi:hypothetical protein
MEDEILDPSEIGTGGLQGLKGLN